jgi:hypothetical protein
MLKVCIIDQNSILVASMNQEKFEDTKGIISSRKSKITKE